MTCRACGKDAPDGRLTVREMMFGTREPFEYVRCGACGSVNIAAVPDDLERHYRDGYYSLDAPPEPLSTGLKATVKRLGTSVALRAPVAVVDRAVDRDLLPLYLRWFAGLRLPLDAAICDVGAGGGRTLAHLAGLGFTNLYGIDPYLTGDRNVSGVRVDAKSISELSAGWDLVMLNHVLEHLPAPADSLAELGERLATGGRILVRVPLADSWAAREYGPDWVGLDAPRHLMVPTVEGVQRLADRARLRIVRTFWDSTPLQFRASELYARDVALNEATVETRPEWVRRARELNARGEGDAAGFVLAPG